MTDCPHCATAGEQIDGISRGADTDITVYYCPHCGIEFTSGTVGQHEEVVA